MSTNEMESKVRELRELQQLIEEATAEAEALKDAIKAEMTARGAEELSVGLFKVRWKTVSSSRFDASAFRATHKELYEQYTHSIVTRRFTVA